MVLILHNITNISSILCFKIYIPNLITSLNVKNSNLTEKHNIIFLETYNLFYMHAHQNVHQCPPPPFPTPPSQTRSCQTVKTGNSRNHRTKSQHMRLKVCLYSLVFDCAFYFLFKKATNKLA